MAARRALAGGVGPKQALPIGFQPALLLVFIAVKIDGLGGADVHDEDETRRGVGLADPIGRFGQSLIIEAKSAVFAIVQDPGPSGCGERVEVLARKTALPIVAFGVDLNPEPPPRRCPSMRRKDWRWPAHGYLSS